MDESQFFLLLPVLGVGLRSPACGGRAPYLLCHPTGPDICLHSANPRKNPIGTTSFSHFNKKILFCFVFILFWQIKFIVCSTLKTGLGLGVWHSLSLGQGSRFHPQDEKKKNKENNGTQVRRPMQPWDSYMVSLGASIVLISCIRTVGGAG